MYNEKISVIIPVYNAEEYLGDCLDSILSSTHRNLEILLINDGSKDKSEDVAKHYSQEDDRIRYIRQENTGASSARNHGIDLATGDYITFVDDDDTIDTTMYEKLLKLIHKHNAEIAFCSRQTVSSYYKDDWCSRGGQVFKNGAVNVDMLANRYDYNMLWNKLIRSDIVGSTRLNPKISFGEDIDVVVDWFSRCKAIAYTPEKLYNYFLRDNNTSFKLKKSDDYYYNLCKVWEKVVKYDTSKEVLTVTHLTELRRSYQDAYEYGSKSLKKKTHCEFRELYKELNYEFKTLDRKLSFLFCHFPALYVFFLKVKNR